MYRNEYLTPAQVCILKTWKYRKSGNLFRSDRPLGIREIVETVKVD